MYLSRPHPLILIVSNSQAQWLLNVISARGKKGYLAFGLKETRLLSVFSGTNKFDIFSLPSLCVVPIKKQVRGRERDISGLSSASMSFAAVATTQESLNWIFKSVTLTSELLQNGRHSPLYFVNKADAAAHWSFSTKWMLTKLEKKRHRTLKTRFSRRRNRPVVQNKSNGNLWWCTPAKTWGHLFEHVILAPLQWRIYDLVRGGGVLGKGLCVPKARSARVVRAMPPPLGNVWNIVAFSCILWHLLTNFRDSEKEFSAHTSVFHWNYSSALCWGMVRGIPSRKIDKITCSLLDSRAFSGLNSNKFRSFVRNQLLLFPTFTNIVTNNGNMLKNY